MFVPPGRSSLSVLYFSNNHPNENFPFISVKFPLSPSCSLCCVFVERRALPFPLLMGHRSTKLVLRWEEVGYIFFSSAAERGVTFLYPASFYFLLFCCCGAFSSFFFPLNSESHHPLSSLVEIHREIQKYLGDTD